MLNSILVTGGAGFIGTNFILRWLATEGTPVINLDALTYAGNPHNFDCLGRDPRYRFVQGDINDRALVRKVLRDHEPRAIVHFAAESHVDRSILGPGEFVRTNVTGTFHLLEEARDYWKNAMDGYASHFRFLHVSTDEVYGSVAANEAPRTENSPYAPASPYSASKAAADHFVRAYHQTYGLPTIITNCSNNYGPYQFPEKLISLTILNAVRDLPLPVYGDGQHVRDWLYVTDHCDALKMVLARGLPGSTYNIGGGNQKTNLEVVGTICSILDELRPRSDGKPHASSIVSVKDRPGHDRRYAVDTSKIRCELGWAPVEAFETGIRKTVEWYLSNPQWIDQVSSGQYREWTNVQYAAVW